jgi:hypothetical protein
VFAGTLASHSIDFVTLTIASPGGGTDTARNIENFRFADGTVVQDGNITVDDLFYSLRNPDVWAAGVDPDAHYADFGWKEGRDPNAFFSTIGYLGAYPDVKAAGINPLDHYNQFGWKEGRDPGANFDTSFYLIHSPDVAQANINPLEHYLEFGRFEARLILPAVGFPGQIPSTDFDPQFYLLSNTDVAAAGVNPSDHFFTTGWQEGRDPNGLFDTSFYLSQPRCRRFRHQPVAALWPVRLAGGPRSVGAVQHKRLSRGQSRCRGRRDQPARSLPPLRPIRGPPPLALKIRRLPPYSSSRPSPG